MKTITWKLAAILTLASAASGVCQTSTNTESLAAKAFKREFTASVGGTYNTATHKGGTDVRGGYFFTPNFGVEAGSMWQGTPDTAFNNLSFGLVARLPLDKWMPKAHLSAYFRGGGQYDWHDWSTTTYSAGKTVTVGGDPLPCQDGTTPVTVKHTRVATVDEVGHWAGYFGPGFEWRAFQDHPGLLGRLGLFGEYSYWMRSGAPNNSLFECGVRFHY